MRATLLVISMLVAPRFVGAQTAPSMDARAPRYTTRGVIEELRHEQRQIVIRHEAVPGYMPAMTMPFFVEDLSLFEGLATRQRVELTFSVEGRGRHVIRAIRGF